ncbi:type IV secretion system protein TrbL [Sphingomonas zeicaulis]|uniref:P-type conjugative transfer protein TrbL n=1 Tax=Sphingomonas zeicaulis TaxID=1632740 RepID=UPI003D1DA6C6
MDDLSVIDTFMDAFIRYIDSGFGLLGGDVAFLTSVLIGIDITLAGLFWALGGEDDVIARLLRKILHVGAFAFIINSFSMLADIIFRSFAGLGLIAGGGMISADDLLKPGHLAGVGFEAASPLLVQAGDLMGFASFFDNFLMIIILLLAWLVVIVAFFVLAIQLLVTILEFKLTTLAGFVLVPFALWNRTSFLAERVLGNVVSAGIKVMVLAVIVGIGSGFFADFIGALHGREPDLEQAVSLMLASGALLGLGLFGPGIASGLVGGAPQLGAGAVVSTAVGAASMLAVGGGAALGAARLAGAGALGAVRSGTAMGSAASTAFKLDREAGGSGIGGVAAAAKGALGQRVGGALGLSRAAEQGRTAAWSALTGHQGAEAAPGVGSAEAPPPWARRIQSAQQARQHRQAALQALREGDRGGAAAIPDISEKDE